MRTIFQWLRWVCLLLLALAWTTTSSFAAVGALNQANGGLTIRYDALETQNRGYDAEPLRAWDNNPPEMVDASAFFSSPAQFLAAKTTLGSYRPPNALPREKNGEMVPSSPNPHTQLGTETSRKAGDYTAAREWGANGQPVRDIHFTDHGRPSVPGHVNPHQPQHIPNPTGGTPQYGPAKPYNW